MKYIIAIVTAAFTLGACCTKDSCPVGGKKAACSHGTKGDACCAEKAPAKKK